MKKEINLAARDERYRDEIESAMNDVISVIIDFYEEYDVTVSGFTYDSTKNNELSTSITFDVVSDKFYPKLEILFYRGIDEGLSLLNSPLSGIFAMGGISDNNIKQVCSEFNLQPALIVYAGRKNFQIPDEEVQELIAKSKRTLGEWKNYAITSDIFMF